MNRQPPHILLQLKIWEFDMDVYDRIKALEEESKKLAEKMGVEFKSVELPDPKIVQRETAAWFNYYEHKDVMDKARDEFDAEYKNRQSSTNKHNK